RLDADRQSVNMGAVDIVDLAELLRGHLAVEQLHDNPSGARSRRRCPQTVQVDARRPRRPSGMRTGRSPQRTHVAGPIRNAGMTPKYGQLGARMIRPPIPSTRSM